MAVTQFPPPRKEKVGSKYWMNRVGDSIADLEQKFSVDAVHGVRVALRRCIAIADRMEDLAPASPWNPMRKKARKLFKALGALRDCQVLSEWVQRLDPDGANSSSVLLSALRESDEVDRSAAQQELSKFDRKQWREWSKELAPNYRRVTADRQVCECLAVEALENLRHRHRLMQRNPSAFTVHRLRREVKTFRYTIENFLPNLYPAWAPEMKFMQDVLGETHDVDVLSQTIKRNRTKLGEGAGAWWESKLEAERSSRIQQYREKMADGGPLAAWREILPAEREHRALGVAKLSAWASFLTPDFARTRRIAKFALQLKDGFSNSHNVGKSSEVFDRSILQAAALLQDVGQSKKEKAYQKQSFRMIRRCMPPIGWSKRDLAFVAAIARFHRRALPRADHKILKDFPPGDRHEILLQIALLRLANAFGSKAYKPVRRVHVEQVGEIIVVHADGFNEGDRITSRLATAVHLLESVLLHPVRILPRGVNTAETTTIISPPWVLAAHSS